MWTNLDLIIIIILDPFFGPFGYFGIFFSGPIFKGFLILESISCLELQTQNIKNQNIGIYLEIGSIFWPMEPM